MLGLVQAPDTPRSRSGTVMRGFGRAWSATPSHTNWLSASSPRRRLLETVIPGHARGKSKLYATRETELAHWVPMGGNARSHPLVSFVGANATCPVFSGGRSIPHMFVLGMPHVQFGWHVHSNCNCNPYCSLSGCLGTPGSTWIGQIGYGTEMPGM